MKPTKIKLIATLLIWVSLWGADVIEDMIGDPLISMVSPEISNMIDDAPEKIKSNVDEYERFQVGIIIYGAEFLSRGLVSYLCACIIIGLTKIKIFNAPEKKFMCPSCNQSISRWRVALSPILYCSGCRSRLRMIGPKWFLDVIFIVLLLIFVVLSGIPLIIISNHMEHRFGIESEICQDIIRIIWVMLIIGFYVIYSYIQTYYIIHRGLEPISNKKK